jgi:hypothetical protein
MEKKQRYREESRLRHELEPRGREAELEVLKRKQQTEEERGRIALRFRCTTGACVSSRGGIRQYGDA